MDLQKIVDKAEAEIADKRERAHVLLSQAEQIKKENEAKRSELHDREVSLGKLGETVDKKIAKLENLEEMQRSEHDRAVLLSEAQDLMAKAKKASQDAETKRIEAESMMKVAEDRELKIKDSAKNYKKQLKEAAISNLLDLMFKEV